MRFIDTIVLSFPDDTSSLRSGLYASHWLFFLGTWKGSRFQGLSMH